ncbi:MAG: DNA alkylation repair protein [Pseudomonadota bacterium]
MKKIADPEKKKVLQRFFKTGPGQYGEGDVFIGIKVPDLRKLSKKYKDLSFKEIKELLKSEVHEERILAIFIMILQYNKGDDKLKKKIFDLYLKSTKHINNWDLVDLSAHHIVGDYLNDKDRSILFELAKTNDLWKKRISMISCFFYIRKKDFSDALKISKILLNDDHDLIHKAVGWMLREIGNRDLKTEETFLKKHYKKMPRTMLRYAIEKFEEGKRQDYLKGRI